eukprot:g2107.t3
MSGILLRWLNEDLVLKQRVLNLEHDMSNGYLLGEILHVHNQQRNFHLFQEMETSEAKVNNFILLEPSLRLLGVPFDAQVAYNVMQRKPGMASRLLYQVKMVLDRLTKFSVPVSMRPNINPGVKPLPNLPHRAARPQYDRATHAIFAAAVRDMVQSQKGINLDRSLQRFELEGARQRRMVQVEKERSLLAEELHTEAIRMQGIHDLAQRKALCDSWENNNVDDWLVNMGRKRDREFRNHLFQRRVNAVHLSRLQRAKIAGERAVHCDLADFEARSREAFRTAGGNQEEHEATPWAFAASARGFLEARALEKGYKWQMAKFHSKRSEERTGAREKRRRRYITEREESQSHEHLQEGTDALKKKLMKRCHAEELVDRQLESVFRYKEIMTENRMYRTQQYAARADVDAEGLLKRDQASLDSFRRDYELGVRAQAERCEAAALTTATAALTRVEKMCRETLEGVFALSMEVVRYRAYSEHRREPSATAPDQDPIPTLQWKDMKWSFIRGGPVLDMAAASVQPMTEWGRNSLLPLATSKVDTDPFCSSNCDDETVEKVACFLDLCELQDYMDETGWWERRSESPHVRNSIQAPGVAHATLADPVTLTGSEQILPDGNGKEAHDFGDPSKSVARSSVAGEGSILNTINPLHALGECVIETSLEAIPLPPPEPHPTVPTFSLRICMCGRTLTGKSEQAIRLADRYCLKVLSAEELAQKAMDNAANALAAGRKILSREEALGQEASSALLQGGTISDKVYAALLVEAIKEIEEENKAARAEINEQSDGQGVMPPDGGRAEYMGWIIDDFPGTTEQARVLEKYLSGYDENAHVPSRMDAASKLAPVCASSDATTEKEPLVSGIDLALYIDAPRDTILKRSLGRLFDPVTAEPYHFEGSLPQYDVVCKERLVHPEDPANASAQLSLQVATQATAKDKNTDGSDQDQHLAEHLHNQGDPSNTSKTDSCLVNGMTDGKVTPGEPQPQEGAVIEDGLNILGKDSSCGTFESTTGSRADSQEHGKEGGLLTGGLAVALSGHWRAAETQFVDTARRVFRELRNQRFLVGCHVRVLRDTFSAFLQRPDDKQTTLAEFCGSFNLIDQDLRFDDRACKELLLRTEEFRSKLWLDIEERKARATAVLKTIKADGWLERQTGMVFNHMILLMQAEVERFHAGVLLLHDFYQIKVQGVTGDNSVVLVPLLPPEAEGLPLKETSATKSTGKRDKEGKGGGKKGQESKGGKGSKGDPSGDASSGSLGQTAWPPCVALSSLVEVISNGNMSQVVSEIEENTVAPASGKGKVEKGKKVAKKTPGKLDMVEAMPPKPLLLHRAVWAQAEVLAQRCQLLLRAGETLSAELRRKADLVHGELQRCLDERVSVEAQAVEAAMGMAKGCIDDRSLVEYEWNIQGGSFVVDQGARIVPMSAANVPNPVANENFGLFSIPQVLNLRHALNSIQLVGAKGFDHPVVMADDVIDILLRLSAEEGALPESWACAPKHDLIQVVATLLGQEGNGQVEVEKVVSSVTSRIPSQIILT